MRKLVLIASTLLLTLQGCAYTARVPSANGAAEVMPTRRISSPAYIRVEPELAGLNRKASLGYMCGAHTYKVDIGPAVTESIMQTMEGAFTHVVRVDAQSEAKSDGYFLDFYLSDFYPRLRFEPGFWTVSSEGSAELSIRVKAYDGKGDLVFQTTARGEARSDNSSGGCPDGDKQLVEAGRKTIQRVMEDLVQKLINSRVLTETREPAKN
ncbi:hypothetical protein D0850_16255 [Bordetella avium]|uniref:hypothetical protein n=1 Tax=Bordetella avium TaxID=521 RepID=UPI000EC2D421|nr:hypothetical protein [Bordetella avium]RIQ16063.1 hypothetical protein D0850_16255 [Bordetella avium]